MSVEPRSQPVSGLAAATIAHMIIIVHICYMWDISPTIRTLGNEVCQVGYYMLLSSNVMKHNVMNIFHITSYISCANVPLSKNVYNYI